MGNVLYKKSYSKFHSYPYLRCLEPNEAEMVMQEIHVVIVGITQEAGPSLTKPSIRGTMGLKC